MPPPSQLLRILLKPLRTLRAIAAYQVQPPPMEEFSDYNEYWDKRGAPAVIYRRWQLAADAMDPGASVLDVGCGSNGFLDYLKQRRPDLVLTGCDTSSAAVQRAREAGFDAFVHDIGQTPLSGSFDYITCFEVLEHIPHAETALRNMKTAFRKKLFVSVPNIGCLRCRFRLALFGRFPLTVCNLHVNEHVRHWTPRDFAYWMQQEGLTIEQMDGQYGLRGFYRWFPSLFAHGVMYTLGHNPKPAAPARAASP